MTRKRSKILGSVPSLNQNKFSWYDFSPLLHWLHLLHQWAKEFLKNGYMFIDNQNNKTSACIKVLDGAHPSPEEFVYK